MKNWLNTLLIALLGIAASAIVFLIVTPPRGEPVELLPAPTPAPILVHIVGAVGQPGVYPLPRESRVQDAIQAAGGFAEDADQKAVNLAVRLKDGEKITVPGVGDPVTPEPVTPESSRSGSIPVGPVDLNSATLEELQTLPGIGETKAKAIIQYREQNNGFDSIQELQEVNGIGPATFENLKELVTVN